MGLKDLFKFLKEETMRLSEDSVDSQIDSVMLRYQNESSVEPEEVESSQLHQEGYRMPDNWNLLLEAGEEGEAPDPSDIMAIGDDYPQATEPADPKKQKIDIDEFAQKVANLAENYESLLNIKPVIIKRAQLILEDGYPPDVVNEFLEILEREFGLTPNGDADVEDDEPMAPPGGVAGPGGGGV